ncbi:MAG: hypothetical protein PWQ39_1210 [Thermacetogenium sp.]|nr:hypothetical protein [Thermacetogenium sp.]
MLIQAVTAVALRCPECGKIKYYTLSLFHFAGQNRTVRFSCDCGAPLLSVATRDRRVFYMQLDCLMCEAKHLYHYSFKEIWSPDVVSLICEETGLEVGFIGPRRKVKKCIARQEKSLREMAEDLGFSDYFSNPEIMYEILDFLHKLASEGKLSCQCGNPEIEVEIFAERVELRCSRCGAVGVIGAETKEDCKAIKNTWEIVLKPGTLQWVGRGKVKSRKRRSKE